MKLWAISDLHVASDLNRRAVATLRAHPEDWLILAGDIADTMSDLAWVFETLAPRFARLVWTPGNHELWRESAAADAPRGVERYEALIELARAHRVLTPEDAYASWPADGQTVIAPLFTLYDYSVRPPEVARGEVVAWAAQQGIFATDERRLDPAPYGDIVEWCHARVALTARRLAEIPPGRRTVLIDHYPLRPEDVILPRKPRYAPWSGTRATADWHRRFGARAVVYGHLHVRASRFADGVHFQEVSLGYPRHWDQNRGIDAYLRRIL